MTPERVELVGRLFEPYGNLEGFGPALELVEHVRELQAFVIELAEYLATPAGPAKVAGYYQMQRRAEALRVKIQPLRQASPAPGSVPVPVARDLSVWERLDLEHEGREPPMCM